MPWISKSKMRKRDNELEAEIRKYQQCNQVLRLLPTPVFTIDKKFNVTFINPAGANLVGKNVEETIGQKCYNLFRTTHCNTSQCSCARAMQTREVCTGETVADPDGLNMPIQYTGSPLLDENGNISGALEYLVDFTETRRAMDKAQISENNLANLPTPVMTIDRDYSITFMNAAGAKVLGETPQSVIGKKCFNLFKTSHCNTSECCCRQAMDNDGIFNGETISNPDGKTIPIGYTGAPIKDYNGNITGALEFITDMTDIKEAQAKTDEILDFLATQVDSLSRVLESMGNGDLTVRFKVDKGNDNTLEIKNSCEGIADNLNKTLDSLNDILNQVNVGIDQVSTGAQQVSDASQSLSQGATEQASSLQEVTSTMVQFGSQIKTNSENAGQVNQLAAKAREDADRGNNQMQEMVNAMNEINDSSKEIGRIIKVIDEIAFQTNLLALNAAVEAARAGAHGKGFAVVAEEVRNLAKRSADAAKETTELIEGSKRKVETGARIAGETENALVGIVSGIKQVTDIIGEIAFASKEQSTAIEQINESLNQIDQVTQGNTSNAEESASAAEELSSQGMHLKQMISRFRLEGNQLDDSFNHHRSREKRPHYKERRILQNQIDFRAIPQEFSPAELIRLDDTEFADL